MGIANTIALLGGLGFFLFGMTLLGDGLKRVAGGKLEIILAKLTSTTFKGVLLGTLVTAVIPYLSYTQGLQTVEASRAGIIATIEPLVATLVGVLVFSEPLTLMNCLGIALILSAVVILNRKTAASCPDQILLN